MIRYRFIIWAAIRGWVLRSKRMSSIPFTNYQCEFLLVYLAKVTDVLRRSQQTLTRDIKRSR
ncbi:MULTISPECIES: hypothetical protein [unclassified Nostoc]|uniref:hypothetical protein n=1 Tax=unclassified Nostoc TaxID=2593658 RepID=UPI002627C865|nr:hypothetical protein [Nostoc sp. S13]MDF5739534.1 hypothetical protein [Nostoc sp. S13]